MDTFDGKDIDKYSKGIKELLTTKAKTENAEAFDPFKQMFTPAKAKVPARSCAGVGARSTTPRPCSWCTTPT